jgi:hypothetical protein
MALPNPNIQLGAPPLLWSDVQTAFTRVNENFDSVAAALGVAGLTPIDFETLDTSVSPTIDSEYSLGSSTNKWANVYTSEYSTVPGEELNGVWIGTAHIKGISGTVDLPLSSTIDGSLIIDPNKTTFKIVNVEGEGEIIASSFTDTLNFVNGTAIRLTVNSGSDSIIFDNTGVIKVSGTVGQIGVTYTGSEIGTGEITLTNLGVVSLLSTTALPSGRTEGAGININAANGSNIKITNTGVLSISSVTASLTVTPNAATGNIELENLLPAYPAFGNIVANAGLISAVGSSSGTTLNIEQGYGIALSTNNTTKTLTISLDNSSGAIDLNASIFADNSTLLVDGVSGLIPAEVVQGTFTGSHVGDSKGSVFADDSTLLVDAVLGVIPAAVVVGTFTGSVIGNVTGNTTGTHDGDVRGSVFADDSTLLVDGTGGKIVGPINSFDGGNSITMDPVNGVIIGGTAGAQIIGAAGAPVYIGGGTSGGTSGDIFLGNGTNRVLFVSNIIDTDDSSALIFEPPVTFNTDVTFENDITVAEQLTVKGSRVINITELQAITAASTSFSDFQSRIAALV